MREVFLMANQDMQTRKSSPPSSSSNSGGNCGVNTNFLLESQVQRHTGLTAPAAGLHQETGP